MRYDKYIISILLFSVVVVAGLTAVANVADNYGEMGIEVDVDTTQDDAFNKVASINEQTQDISDSVSGTDVGTDDASSTFLGGAWSAVQIIATSFGAVGDIVKEIADLFQIPSLFVTFFITAIVLSVLITAIFMIFKFTGES